MALGYGQGSIAGVDLEDSSGTPCKVLLVDAANFKATFVSSTTFAADGTPFTQVLEIATGQGFGVRVEYIPPDVLNDIVEAVNAAMLGSGSFNVTLADDVNSINSNCIVDGNGWLKIEPQRTNESVIKGVDFRFMKI
jgi:hypothetical protein